MAAKLYPPYINGTLPAFWLNYDASKSVITGASITIPFTANPAVGQSVTSFYLRLRTASTGSYIFEPILAELADVEKNEVTFNLTATLARKLKEGQYYKAQIAYNDTLNDNTGYFSTVGIIKCTSKPTVSIANLALENINFYSSEFIGLYDVSNCKDQSEKVYSYSFKIYDENDELYYDSGELLHNASYDTDYGYSIDRITVNEFVTRDVTYSIQYNVTTLNNLQMSSGLYKLTNGGFDSLTKDFVILPESNLDNGYITINFKGELDKDRSYYYVLNDVNLETEKDEDDNYLRDNENKTVVDRVMDGIKSNPSHISYMKKYTIFKRYNNGLDLPFLYVSRLSDFTDNMKLITINDTEYYCDREAYNNLMELIDAEEATLEEEVRNLSTEDYETEEEYLDAIARIREAHQTVIAQLKYDLRKFDLYHLVSSGKDLTKSLTYKYVEDNNYYIDESGTRLMTGLGDSYYMIDTEEFEAYYYGAFLLSRASDADNYSTWTNIERFRLEQEPPSAHSVKDFTIEHGRKYIYAILQYNIWGLYSARIVSDAYLAGFEDAFLYDGKRALKIRFNPEISSFKTTILELKTDTLGGRFPYITRNGETYYKEFPIAGLIAAEMDEEELFINRGNLTSHRHSSPAVEAYEPENALRDYHMFSDENIMLEREFKLEVLNWLNDGKPKLFKSPYEGNYIVRLMNTSLSPVKELGRMLHSFSTTAYEIAECTYDNLVAFGFINLSEPSDFVGLWKSINLADYPAGQEIHLGFDGGLTSFTIQDMMPGDIVEIVYASGEPTTEKIMIGITGAYMCGGIDRSITEIIVHPRHLVPEIGDKNLQKMTGIINCYYKGTRITAFDAITNMQLRTIPSQQFIGVDPKLLEMRSIDWTKKNNSGTFVLALNSEGFANFLGYTIRDYIDKIIEKTERTNGVDYYFISDEGLKYINAFDPGDLTSRINATINLGQASKIELLKLEQGHFRLRELVPVYAQNSKAGFLGSQLLGYDDKGNSNDTWMVSVTPYGYPHPIEELTKFEMIDPFCVFEVYTIQDGHWLPVKGPKNQSPYYDPYYNEWLYDYEPYFLMNYLAKKISYIGESDTIAKPYKRSEITLVTNSETGESYYMSGDLIIPEERIYDYEIKSERITERNGEVTKYYYVISLFNDIDGNPVEEKIYIDQYNYYELLGEAPRGAPAVPTTNSVYYVKLYDNTIDLSIIKEKIYKDFENINSIRIGNGIIAELTFQIRIMDFYTEISDSDVIRAKLNYLNAAEFYRTIMQIYATIAHAYETHKKYTALSELYERLLRGKNTTTRAEMKDEDKEIIRQLLGYEQDKKDLNLMTVYQALLLDTTTLGGDISELVLDYLSAIGLKDAIMQMKTITDAKARLDNILVYATPYYEYSLVDLNEDIPVAGHEDVKVTLENINSYNYYVYTDWDTRLNLYYFASKLDINDHYSRNPLLIKENVAIDPQGKIIENINRYNLAAVQLLTKVDYEVLYEDILTSLNTADYAEYKKKKECLWIAIADEAEKLHEENAIRTILEEGTTYEGAQSKLEIIEEEIEEFQNAIDNYTTEETNLEVEYIDAYKAVLEALEEYNQCAYFEWGIRYLKEILLYEKPGAFSLSGIESLLNNTMTGLVSYNTIMRTIVKQIYDTIVEIDYALTEDYEKIRKYQLIIEDKSGDGDLDNYNENLIALSKGKVLMCIFEAYSSGQKILQLLCSYWDSISEAVMIESIETYKKIYVIFATAFEYCLDKKAGDNVIDVTYINGLALYYENLLSENQNLVATMKSGWLGSGAVDLDQYREYSLNDDELYFIYFMLSNNKTIQNSVYILRNGITKEFSFTPRLQANNTLVTTILEKIKTAIQKGILTEEDAIFSYVKTTVETNTISLNQHRSGIDLSWMTVLNDNKESYRMILNDNIDFLNSLASERFLKPYFIYFNEPKADDNSTSNTERTLDAFIYNPMAEAGYRKLLTKLGYNEYTTYYEKSCKEITVTKDDFNDKLEYYTKIENTNVYLPVTIIKDDLPAEGKKYWVKNNVPYSVVSGLKAFKEGNEYYILNGNNYVSVYNTINTVSDIVPSKDFTDTLDFTFQSGEERKNNNFVVYYYDTTESNYKVVTDGKININTVYYARKPLNNKNYFESLENELQNIVLSISYGANTWLNNINEYLMENLPSNINNNTIKNTYLDKESTTGSRFISNMRNKLSVPEKETSKKALEEALSAYNAIIVKYLTTLKTLLKTGDVNKNLKSYNWLVNDYNNRHSTNFKLSDTDGEIIYTLGYSESPSINNDSHLYFYYAEEQINDRPLLASNVTKDGFIYNDTIAFLDDENLTFFTKYEDGVLSEDGVVAWYKTWAIQQELDKYRILLKQAIELKDLYTEQYENYEAKYQEYYAEAEESNEIYANYAGTEELDFYLKNDSGDFIELRLKVKEAWWAFLNILDERYTAEKARGFYV